MGIPGGELQSPVLLRGCLSGEVGKGQVDSGHRLGAGGYRAEGTRMDCVDGSDRDSYER